MAAHTWIDQRGAGITAWATIFALIVAWSNPAISDEGVQVERGVVVTADGEELRVACPTEGQSMTGRDMRLPYGCRQLDRAGRVSLTLSRYIDMRRRSREDEGAARIEAMMAPKYEALVVQASRDLKRCASALYRCESASSLGVERPMLDAPAWVWVSMGVIALYTPKLGADAAGLGSEVGWSGGGLGLLGVLGLAVLGGD